MDKETNESYIIAFETVAWRSRKKKGDTIDIDAMVDTQKLMEITSLVNIHYT
jgi:hypothetical protein